MNQPTETSRHYCLVKLSECARFLQQAASELPKLQAETNALRNTGTRAQTKKRIACLYEMKNIQTKLIMHLQASAPLLAEAGEQALCERFYRFAELAGKFDFLNTDCTLFCKTLEQLQSVMPTETSVNASALGHLMNRVKLGYFPTDAEHVAILKNAIVFPEKTVNLLDPCCGCGLALHQFAFGEATETYGVELDAIRREEAEARLSHVGYGDFFQSKISPEAFHCVFLNPPYLSVMTQGGNIRMEKSFLAGSLPHLMLGGLLVYIIPYYRATLDVCEYLCENLDSLSVFRFMGKEYERFHQIMFLGIKSKWRKKADPVMDLYDKVLHPERLPPLRELPRASYELPNMEKKAERFRGTDFNEKELAEQMGKSDAINRIFDESKLQSREMRPLLPLKLSQIGLIGGSGLLNGLVPCETPHIMKGRIVKQKKTTETRVDKFTSEISQVESNKLIFKILTPQGVKSLT